MRIRITFAKTDAMRYTGHLDLYRAWERTLRRSGLPLVYSQGFNPRPRINLASALPLGFTSEAEVMDFRLIDELPLSQVELAIAKTLPPGILLNQVAQFDKQAPALQSQLQAAEYRLTLLEPLAELDQRIEAVLGAGQLASQRRGKSYDLRPLILALRRLPDDEHGRQRLQARLTALEGATGRPDEVLRALGADPTNARVHRTQLIFREP